MQYQYTHLPPEFTLWYVFPGMDAFDGEIFGEQVREITVLQDGNLQFRFSDGSEM